MELTSKAVEYQLDSGVAWIKLASPRSGNALNSALISQLSLSLEEAINDESCRVITISAIGSDFCKGLDLEEAFATGGLPDQEFFKMFLDCLTLIHSSSRPVIACVEGNVTGGGVGLVAACDMVLASNNAVFMLSEALVGMIPAMIAPFLLRRLTPARLRYMALSTRGIPAPEAQIFGLVDEVASEGMSQTLNRQLQRLFCCSPEAIAQSKQYFEQLHSVDLHRQTEIALNQLMSWLKQPEVIEGIEIFTEGFSPPWFQKYKGQSHV
ncbi:enoyl-CoA hydratase/isomerase family protein [Microcoleus asticus]|uniref:Polyketide biosynthesis enoyl-CoA hydratase PksH n=1 Tax=Microcoleus asticus IPMA8 TaxID=2563858 RepID=A0ABX2CY88_9CYAN|nr:enoyl-CoA hydratase/isomerase family protein [Microcoleus asticus]NQE34727.1 putative polyketide biosynthesis enoyl-CoA hydratase PksH [Microcoleus asticus IPMA8]